MKEYTVLAFCSAFAAIAIDAITKIRIFKKGIFYVFLLIIFCFKMLVNGYLTATGIVIYNPEFFLGLRLASIALEDFFFGFSMVALTLIFWEYFNRDKR